MFSNEELKNILILIGRANITGQEATATAILQQKIHNLITPEVDPKTVSGTTSEVEVDNKNNSGTK